MNRRLITCLPLFLFVAVACDTSSAPEATQTPTQCEAPDFTPTYFPWDEGSIAEPETFLAQGNAIVQWVSDEPVGQLSLVRRVRPWEDNEDFPAAQVRGNEGHLVWIGDPGTGELSIQWSEGDGACDHYGVYLLQPGSSQRAAEREIARVVRSLR